MAQNFMDAEVKEAIKRTKEVMLTFGYRQAHNDRTILREHLANLRIIEKKRMPYARKSPQIQRRGYLVKTIFQIAHDEKLESETVYLGIYLLDRFMDNHDILVDTLPFIVIVCMVVAGKLIEVIPPKYKHFAGYINDGNCMRARVRTLVCLERYVLDALKFRIFVPTEINFLEVYLLFAIDGRFAYEENQENKNNNNNNENCMPNANYPGMELPSELVIPPRPRHRWEGEAELHGIQDTAHRVLQHLTIVGAPTKYPPSLIAAAVLMAARREHKLNFWTTTLFLVSSYSASVVRECLRAYVEPNVKKMSWKQPFDPPEFFHPPGDEPTNYGSSFPRST